MLPLQLTVELTTTDHDSLISLVQKYPSVICYSSQPYSRSTKTFFRNLPLTGLLTMHILPGPCQRRRIYFNKENNASKRTAAVSCMLSPTKIPLSPDKLQKHPCLWRSGVEMCHRCGASPAGKAPPAACHLSLLTALHWASSCPCLSHSPFWSSLSPNEANHWLQPSYCHQFFPTMAGSPACGTPALAAAGSRNPMLGNKNMFWKNTRNYTAVVVLILSPTCQMLLF